MKVIQILHHCPPEGVGFWEAIFEGWHSKTGRAVMKVDCDLQVECWQPVSKFKKIVFERDGVIYRLFPSIQPQFYTTLSPSLIKQLKGVIKEKEFIVHIHGDRSLITYTILQLLAKKRYKILLQHHGSKGSSVFTSIERRLFKHAKKIFVISKNKANYLKRMGLTKIKVQTMGVDYNVFKPLNKKHARNTIGIEEGKLVILYVGRFYQRKGLPVVLEAFKKLRKKYDLCLVLVGGSVKDPLYNYLLKTSKSFEDGEVICKLRIPNIEMPWLYSSSDLACWFVDNSIQMWGGIGMTMVESLACDTPVVSNTLIHFANHEEIYKVGVIPKSKVQMSQSIEKMLENGFRASCRKTSKKYYDWEVIAKNTVSEYLT